jgi:hypothetical protein
LVSRAETAWGAGDFDGALDTIGRAARLAPGDPSVRAALARMERGAREGLAAVRAAHGADRLPSALAARVAGHERQAAAAAGAGDQVGAIRELLAAADVLARDPGR